MSQTMALPAEDLFPTRYSLLSRLKNWDDQDSWRDFFETYWRLIYSVALKSGLTEDEAQEVVQETIISVAKDLHKFKRDRSLGSFKGWLRNITRWRIADQFRKRLKLNRHEPESQISHPHESEEIADPAVPDLELLWEREWKENLLESAMERVRHRVKEEHYQMFDLYVVKQWPVSKVAETLHVNVGLVYLAKHRILALIKKEFRALEKAELLKVKP